MLTSLFLTGILGVVLGKVDFRHGIASVIP